MKNRFHILGNGETILGECATEKEAYAWLAGYTKTGFGGWVWIVLHFYGEETNDVIDSFYADSWDE
jgi:hypothetical protein